MQRYFLLIITSFLVYFTTESYAQISFDSLSAFYEAKFKTDLNLSEDSNYFNVSFKAINQELSFSEGLSEQQLMDVLELTAQMQSIGLGSKANLLLREVIVNSKPVSTERAFLYFKSGELYKTQKLTIPALEEYLKSSLILEQLDEEGSLAYVYSRISLINFEGLNNEIALSFANEAIKSFSLKRELNRKDSSILASMYTIKGIVYRRYKEYEEALVNINSSIGISKALGDSLLVSISNGNKAVIFYDMKDYSAAEPLLIDDFEASMAKDVFGSAFNAGVILGNIYLRTNRIQRLDSLFNQVVNLKGKGTFDIPDMSLELFYKLAIAYNKLKEKENLSNSYGDSLQTITMRMDSTLKAQDFERLQEKYLMEKEITKLQLLQKTNELQSSHLKLRTTMLIIIALTLIVVLWYVYVLRHKNRKIDKLNELLEVKVSERTTKLLKINKELDNYLYRASHDIRRPIRTLLGLNNVMKVTDDPQELKLLFEKVYDTAINMDEMLFKLQMAYELNNSHDIEEVDVYELIDSCIIGMDRLIKQKNAKVTVNRNDSATCLKANNALLKIVIDNIVENALIYHNVVQPEIIITTDIGKYYFYIQIEDNGYGIDKEYYKKIFDSYFKISNKTQGSGLGLFLAYRAVSFLAGDITLESVINEGTQFTIKIPINPK